MKSDSHFIYRPCGHSCPSFAKPIDTSHRVVCHGTLSAGKQAERGQGEVNYTEMLSSNILSDLWLFQMAE